MDASVVSFWRKTRSGYHCNGREERKETVQEEKPDSIALTETRYSGKQGSGTEWSGKQKGLLPP
jgi:hypothetical protein